jgi:hypothetical protein
MAMSAFHKTPIKNVSNEKDDAPISPDSRRENYLRQVARNCAKVLEAYRMLLRELGFTKNHWRLINALTRIGRDRLKPFKASHTLLLDEYRQDGEAIETPKTIQRDIHKFKDEEKSLGLEGEIIKYWQGTVDRTGKNQSSRFQNKLLRYALEAINLAIDTSNSFEYSSQALEAACKMVAAKIPRNEIQQVTITNIASQRLEAVKKGFSLEKQTTRLVNDLSHYFCEFVKEGADADFLAQLGGKIVSDALNKAIGKIENKSDHYPDKEHGGGDCIIDKNVHHTSSLQEHNAQNSSIDPDRSTDSVNQATTMIEAFESVGTLAFDVTLLNQEGEKTDFTPEVSSECLEASLLDLLHNCQQAQLNIIIRPKSNKSNIRYVQLDDLNNARLEKVESFSVLTIETSPANHQAWLAIENASDEIVRRLKKGIGADVSASGATRIAGSFNFKKKYAPNYPCVKLHTINKGRIVAIDELEQAGLLVREEKQPTQPPRHAPTIARGATRFPSYTRCLADAPQAKNHEGKDRSAADFEFCLIANDRGFEPEAIAQRLMIESEKAQRKGNAYALHTAQRAAQMVAQKRATCSKTPPIEQAF